MMQEKEIPLMRPNRSAVYRKPEPNPEPIPPNSQRGENKGRSCTNMAVIFIAVILFICFGVAYSHLSKIEANKNNAIIRCHADLEQSMNKSIEYLQKVAVFDNGFCRYLDDLETQIKKLRHVITDASAPSESISIAQREYNQLRPVEIACEEGRVHDGQNLKGHLVCMARYSIMLLGRIPRTISISGSEFVDKSIAEFSLSRAKLNCEELFEWYDINYGNGYKSRTYNSIHKLVNLMDIYDEAEELDLGAASYRKKLQKEL